MSKWNPRQHFAMLNKKKQELKEKFDLPEMKGIYIFKRSTGSLEEDSKGIIKDWMFEVYVGQAKNILERCASHYMPLSHDHLAASLKKYNDWKISYKVFTNATKEELDRAEEEERIYQDQPYIFLFNNLKGGQGKGRTMLEGSNLEKRHKHKKLSVENRAKRKLERHIEDSLNWKKYFEIDNSHPNDLRITISPKDCAMLKNNVELTANAIKAKQKLLKLLGEKINDRQVETDNEAYKEDVKLDLDLNNTERKE